MFCSLQMEICVFVHFTAVRSSAPEQKNKTNSVDMVIIQPHCKKKSMMEENIHIHSSTSRIKMRQTGDTSDLKSCFKKSNELHTVNYIQAEASLERDDSFILRILCNFLY